MKKIFRILFLLVVFLAGVFSCQELITSGIETSVCALVGGDSMLMRLADNTSRFIRVYCEDQNRVKECRAVYKFEEEVDVAKFLETIRLYGKGLLTAKSKSLLEKGEIEKIKRSAKRRDYTGVGLFNKAEDPYYFLNDFVVALKALKPDGLTGGAEILTGVFNGSKEDELGLRKLILLAKNEDGIFLSGAPFHTILATDKTKSEINILGSLSLVVVLICGWLLFRNFKFILSTSCALLSGFICGMAAVLLLPGKPHAMTFLFGTTLIGLGVDYCYHSLAEKSDKDFVKKLTYALGTTCVSFVPLLFSSVNVLREMAVFTIVGLIAIYIAVLLMKGGVINSLKWRTLHSFKFLGVIVILILLPIAILKGFSFNSDPTQFHNPTPLMARGEAKVAELTEKTISQMVLVPLIKWQEDNGKLKEKIGDKRGEFLSSKMIPSWLTINMDGTDYFLLPKSIAGDGYVALSPKLALEDLFKKLSLETYILLGVSILIFLGATLFGFRSKFLLFVMPIVCAMISTLCVLTILGRQITFFNMLCFFILMGLGIDYSIFHRSLSSEGNKINQISSKVVFFSFFTSVASFGFLAFTSFPVTESIGETLSVGLLFSYIFSLPNAKLVQTRVNKG